METALKINEVEREQNELRATMAKSDDRQNHCGKTGKDFRRDYPDEAAVYDAAYKKYDENKALLKELYAKQAEEREREEAEAHERDER